MYVFEISQCLGSGQRKKQKTFLILSVLLHFSIFQVRFCYIVQTMLKMSCYFYYANFSTHFITNVIRPSSPSISSPMKTYTSAQMWAITAYVLSTYMQGSGISWDRRSGPPRVQAIRGYLVCREFKNSNKPTKSQSAFYYPFAVAILNNSNSSLLRLMAPITATSPWSTTGTSAQHYIKCFTETLLPLTLLLQTGKERLGRLR